MGELINSRLISVIILCCLGIIIYSNTFDSHFHFDDRPSIVNNQNIKNLANLKAIWKFWPTRFITYLSIAVNYHFHQLHLFGYHLFNLIVHLCSTILVWQLTHLTFLTPAMKDKKIIKYADNIAFFTGLVFLTHPIQTQAVTYIIQRTASLATFFYLASLTLYIKSRLLPHSPSWRYYYSGSLITAVLAMFTKEMTITLPLMLWLYEFYFLKTGKGINWKKQIPFLITLFIIPLTMFLTKSVNFAERRRAPVAGPGISSGHYLLTQLSVLITYIRLLFIPLNQNLDYDYPITKLLMEPHALINFSLLAFILIIAIRIFNRYRLISFSIFWFFLSLLPESSIIPIKDVIFEHRLYLPMVGFGLFLVSIAYYIFGNKRLHLVYIILLIVVAGYSILTYNRNLVWKDEVSLWNDVVCKSPRKARAYHNRGYGYTVQGDIDEAISDYNKAIEIDTNYTEAYYNRGNMYYTKREFDKAIADYNKAITINPDYAEAYCNRGNAYANKNNLEQAISDISQAIQINPGLPNLAGAYLLRGNCYRNKGNFDKALSDYNKAIKISPRYAEVYANRAILYFWKQEYDKSWQDVHKAEAVGYKVNPEFLKDLRKFSNK